MGRYCCDYRCTDGEGCPEDEEVGIKVVHVKPKQLNKTTKNGNLSFRERGKTDNRRRKPKKG